MRWRPLDVSACAEAFTAHFRSSLKPQMQDLAAIAKLIGDSARARMLSRLLDGSSVPSGELAREAGISAQTASGHLAMLLRGGLVVVVPQGRHRYYRLAGANVANALETLAVLPAAAPGVSRVPPQLRFARTCYNHLAGGLGVALATAFMTHHWVVQVADIFTVTEDGFRRLRTLGIEHPATHFAGRTCMDWSERRLHLGGRLGSVLLTRFMEAHWLAKTKIPRALRLTVAGRQMIERSLGLRVEPDANLST